MMAAGGDKILDVARCIGTALCKCTHLVSDNCKPLTCITSPRR